MGYGAGNLIPAAVLALLVGALVGFFLGRYYHQALTERRDRERSVEKQNILENARAEAREIILSAKATALGLRDEIEQETRQQRQTLRQEEQRLDNRRATVEERADRLEQRDRGLNKRHSALDKRANELQQAHSKQLAELERIAKLTSDEAKELLLQQVEKDARNDMARVIRAIEYKAQATADERAQKIIATSVQRTATDRVADLVVSAVPLPSEEMKGRIIGRNGRNIRSFEQAAGVDVIVDDTPEAVTISCFDSVRREIARRSLQRNGLIMVVNSDDEAIALANMCAAEHLCLAVKNARSYLDGIRHAGGVFVDTAEALGDYTAGPSHVMPTGRTARFGSPLSVLDFLRVSILVDLDDEALRQLGPATAAIARAEGFTAHAISVEKRLEALGGRG